MSHKSQISKNQPKNKNDVNLSRCYVCCNNDHDCYFDGDGGLLDLATDLIVY